MSRFRNIHTIKSHILRSAIIFTLGALMLSSASQATLIKFTPQAWDDNPDTPHFILNGSPLAESIASEFDNLTEGTLGTFYWRQEFVRNENQTIKSIAFNGAAAENPYILLHVFTYTQPEDHTAFVSTNTTSHTRTFILKPEDLGQTNLRDKKIKLQSDVILDGFLVIVQDPETDVSGLKASFGVTVSRENGKKAFKGSVQLKTKKNGNVKVTTRGKIKKKHIDSVYIIDDNIFQINFSNKSIPYKTKVKVGEEFSLITEVTGIAVNNGYGTGAEVIFGPGLPGEIPIPTIPTYQLSNKIFLIPEPATIILLTCGGLLMLRPISRKQRI